MASPLNAVLLVCMCSPLVALKDELFELAAPWSAEAFEMPKGFNPPVSNPREIAQFQNSVSEATKFMEKVVIDQSDPFPGLDEFFVFSASRLKWYAFRRDTSVPETLPALPVGAHTEFTQTGVISKQLIITVQRTQQDLYCKANVDQRVDCAIVYDRLLRRQVHERFDGATAGSWVYKPVGMVGRGIKDLTEQFGASVSNACNTLRRDNGQHLGVSQFVVRSGRTRMTYLFGREVVTPDERVQFALAYQGKTYPPEVCPGSPTNGDVVAGKVFPFPGASSWVLQSKWISNGQPFVDSPILDMEDEWSTEMRKLNGDSGRTRIYFVGHSAKGKDFFGDRTGRQYNSKSVAQKLVNSGLSSGHPMTLSFVACNGADVFCPSLAYELQHRGFRQVYLHCREPQAGRYAGGNFEKRVIADSGRLSHKEAHSKTIFFTGSANPRQGVFAY